MKIDLTAFSSTFVRNRENVSEIRQTSGIVKYIF